MNSEIINKIKSKMAGEFSPAQVFILDDTGVIKMKRVIFFILTSFVFHTRNTRSIYTILSLTEFTIQSESEIDFFYYCFFNTVESHLFPTFSKNMFYSY